MRRPLLGLLVFILLGLGVWVLMETPGEETTANHLTEVVLEGTGPAQAVDVSSNPQAEASKKDAVERIVTQPVLAQENPTQAGDFHLTIVNSDSLEPLTGAEVYLLKGLDRLRILDSDQRAPVQALPLELDREEDLGPFLSNADGTVSLPAPEDDHFIIARHGDAVGVRAKTLEKDWAPGMMKVYPDPTLEVKGVDENGKPVANTTLALYSGGSTLYARLQAKTDASGIARFNAPRFHLRNRTYGTYYLGPLQYGSKPELGPFPFTSIPTDAEVVIQTKASLRVRLENEDGSPFLGKAEVSLQTRKTKPRTFNSIPVEEGAGLVTAHGLEPGALFRVWASVNGSQTGPNLEQVAPEAGQEAEVILTMTGNPIALKVLCVDEEGIPMAKSKVRLVWWGEGARRRHLRTASATTDADGFLEVTFQPPEKDRQDREYDSLSAELTHPDRKLSYSGKLEALEKLGSLGDQQLTMVFAKEPILAGGRVTDTEGNPIEGVTVHARQSDSGWADHYGTTKTDAEGKFLIQSEIPDSPAELNFYWMGQRRTLKPLDPGSMEHHQELKFTPFEVRGTLLLPDFAHNFHLLSFEQGGNPTRIDLDSQQGICDFVIPVSSDAPGRLVVLGSNRTEFGALEHVVPVLVGGEANPLLQPWDLRKTVGLAEVEVRIGSEIIESIRLERKVDNGGREVYESLLAYTEDGYRYMIPDGVSVEARLSGAELRVIHVTLHPGKQVIQALPATRGDFRLEGDGTLPPGFKLQLTGRRVERSQLERNFRKDGDPDWEAKFQLPGLWNARLYMIYETGNGKTHKTNLRFGPDGSIDFPFEVPENSTSFEVALPFTSDIVEKAVATLRRKANS